MSTLVFVGQFVAVAAPDEATSQGRCLCVMANLNRWMDEYYFS